MVHVPQPQLRRRQVLRLVVPEVREVTRPTWRRSLGDLLGGDVYDLAWSAATVALVLAAVWLGLIAPV